MAKKSLESLVIASKAKGVLKKAGCNTAGDAFAALNEYTYWLREQAAKRAKANGRKTVRRHDFMSGAAVWPASALDTDAGLALAVRGRWLPRARRSCRCGRRPGPCRRQWPERVPWRRGRPPGGCWCPSSN